MSNFKKEKKMVKFSRWWYRFRGNFYAYGPTTKKFSSERKVRAHLREVWECKRLPYGTEIWRAD